MAVTEHVDPHVLDTDPVVPGPRIPSEEECPTDPALVNRLEAQLTHKERSALQQVISEVDSTGRPPDTEVLDELSRFAESLGGEYTLPEAVDQAEEFARGRGL